MKELIISIVLQDGIAGQSHSSKNQRGFDWILEKTKWLYWHWSPWQPCVTMAQSCPPWLHPQLQPPQSRQSLIARRGMSPWPNLFKPSLQPSQVSAGRESGHLPPHLPVSSFALLGVSLLFVPPRVSKCLRFFGAVCGSHIAANTTGRSLGIFLKQWSCQGPTTVGLWQLLSPGESRLAAGWRWPRSALLCFHIKGRIETTTSDAWQEKKRTECRILPSLDSI